VQIYIAAVKALRKKERQDETQFTTRIDGTFSQVLFESHPVYDQTQGSGALFFLL
jgi:hypothetical protein